MENSLGQGVVDGSSESLDIPPYSLPGVLQFVQHEWARFERERSRWEIERAELQAKLAFLQGERRGQESLKFDLVRRIKMLEYALRQERLKYHKLKYGTVPPPVDVINGSPEPDSSASTSNDLRPGRQLLRQYLQEVNVTDSYLEVRDACRTRMLNASSNSNRLTSGDGMHSRSMSTRSNSVSFSASETNLVGRLQSSSPPPGTERPPGMVEFPPEYKPKAHMATPVSMAMPTPQTAAQSSSQFSQQPLPPPGADMIETVCGDVPASQAAANEAGSSQLDSKFDEDSEDTCAKEEERFSAALVQEPPTWMSASGFPAEGMPDSTQTPPKSPRATSADDTAEVLTRLLGSRSKEEAASPDGGCISRDRSADDKHPTEPPSPKYRPGKRPSRSELATITGQLSGADDDVAPAYLLGDAGPAKGGSPDPGTLHAQPARHTPPAIAVGQDDVIDVQDLRRLTQIDSAMDDQLLANEDRKVWAPKFSLHSHFDSVRSVAFHPTELMMLTGSEDCTIKLWNLDKPPIGKRNYLPDLDPVHTYRGHRGAVLSTAFSPSGQHCFSGGMDGKLRQWSVSAPDDDLYRPYDPPRDRAILLGSHTDCIWDISVHGVLPMVASASADGTCCVHNWSPDTDQDSLVQTLISTDESGGRSVPTSIDFVHNEPGQVMASYRSGQAILYDYETGKPVCSFRGIGSTAVNAVACHPTLSYSIAGLGDRRLVYLDHRTGQVMFNMLAHLDAVTCVSIDPSGLYLLSGSHDTSLRLWTVESRACIQEMTAHRKKNNESVLSVAFHPSKGYLASGGADSVAKVFA